MTTMRLPDPWSDKIQRMHKGDAKVRPEYVRYYHGMKVVFGIDKNTDECVAYRYGKTVTFMMKRPTYEECEEVAERTLTAYRDLALKGTKLDG